MKIKKYLSIILFLFISNLVYSNPVDSTLAKEIAINYFLFLNPSRAELEIKIPLLNIIMVIQVIIL